MTQSPVPASDAAETQFKLATLWEAKGQPARAIAGYEAALRLRPDYAAAYLALAALLEQVGRATDAAAVYRRAAEAVPGEAAFRRRLNAPVGAMDTPADPLAANEAALGERDHILLYTDGASVYGLGQFNHALALGLRAAGYRVTCAQPPTAHSLIDERRAAGIGHAWLDPDDLYDRRVTPRALTDAEEPRRLLAALRPDLVIFSGGAPMSSLAAREAAAARDVPYLVIVHCVTSAWAESFAPYLNRVAVSFAAALDVVAVSEENLTRLRREFGLADNRGR
ncbi:MAG: glycosyltransferase, partial [Anaerolineae bacterium]|nr:glycosyltransferase [Anaerolineae bacterium]